MGRAMQNRVYGHMCTAKAQADLGLHCPLTESMDTTACLNLEQMPG